MDALPLFEREYDEPGIINAKDIVSVENAPRRCVITFFGEVAERIRLEYGAEEIYRIRSEMGEFPLLAFEHNGVPVAMIHCGVGAPLAAGILEEVIAAGCTAFVACGGAGVVDRTVNANRVLVPTAAVRDEGVSYHYLPPAREVEPTAVALEAVRKTVRAYSVDSLEGKTWTTDAIFRETPGIIRRRREEGCISVEMEAAALFAVARYRGIECAQLLYAGDDVAGELWDPRNWDKQVDARERLFYLALEACLAIDV